MTRLVMLDPGGPERTDRIRPYLPEGWELSIAVSRSPEDQVAALGSTDSTKVNAAMDAPG